MSPSEWEGLTPREFAACLDAASERQRHETYNLALLIRAMVWEKRAPSYETAYGGKAGRGRMSDEQMYANVQALNALLGGVEVDECRG